ncbi:hypothetical protein BPMI_04111 [Candidatus Burkholderia pumila]|uniref:Uncharacterized protein n=1 Tax=Candidatus Burkholderia pumila TaxID=1090375 RepID=A0ABR5HND3_9BURK|nr:hypothetical protein BPMI_04111 [Candidatus Burkholderia pumila]
MFVVYWLADVHAHYQRFDANALSDALRSVESLRKRQADSEDVGFVTLCSENPQSVGKPDAADPPADCDWKKRRR